MADELERRWNQALQQVREVELRIEQHVRHHGNFAAAPTREQFEDLASELEAVWSCSETDVRLKKRILRTLIHEIIVDVDADALGVLSQHLVVVLDPAGIVETMHDAYARINLTASPYGVLWRDHRPRVTLKA